MNIYLELKITDAKINPWPVHHEPHSATYALSSKPPPMSIAAQFSAYILNRLFSVDLEAEMGFIRPNIPSLTASIHLGLDGMPEQSLFEAPSTVNTRSVSKIFTPAVCLYSLV
jgi:hypothetical protein